VRTAFVPLSPKFVAGSKQGAPPFMFVRVTFDMSMDIGVLPAVGSFNVIVDGTPFPITGLSWANPTTLDLTWGAPDCFVSGIVNLLTVDLNLRSATGVVACAPQQLQFFP